MNAVSTSRCELIRVAVCGLGVMGRNHARVLESLPAVDLVGIHDVGVEAHSWHGVPVVRDLPELIALDPDYCVVATPTSTHVAISTALARAGIPCLIEKPLAPSLADAGTIVSTFREIGVKAAVGQIERFNPAIVELRDRVRRGDIGQVYSIATRRFSPFPARVSDVGVTMDLATHDLDLARHVIGSDYVGATSLTRYKAGRDFEDLIAVVGEFENSVVASHLVNWLSPLKERVTVVTGELGLFVADTLTADLTLYRNGAADHGWSELAQFGGIIEGDVTRFSLVKREPLVTEHEAFCRYLRNESPSPVSLEDGSITVGLAERIRNGGF